MFANKLCVRNSNLHWDRVETTAQALPIVFADLYEARPVGRMYVIKIIKSRLSCLDLFFFSEIKVS